MLEYDAFHYQHQMPGGMLSNFKSQLAEAGLSDRFDQLLEEVARVREELGYPIMITPFAQLVGTQAVLNVVHGERYRVVPNEIKKYALGYYGKLLAPVAPDVLDRIVENGSKQIALKPVAPEPAVAALRKNIRRRRTMSDCCDTCSRVLRSTTCCAKGRPRMSISTSIPSSPCSSISQRPKIGRVHISHGDFQLNIVGS